MGEHMTDWTNEEEEAFNDVEKHSNLGKQILKDMGQPYHFEVFVSVSQRNQVLEEAAKMCEDNADDDSEGDWDSACISCANLIRGMKK
jgi:hypothetical protein